jgi:menaquinone-specific isochorismate synthase
MVHPDIEKHHLKVIGGFQFSSHKSDDEWREFGIKIGLFQLYMSDK